MNETAGSRAVFNTPELDSGVMGEVQGLLSEFSGLVQDQVKLAALETKQAGATLITLAALGVGAAILLFSAWLGLMGVAVLFVVERGMMMGSTALALAVGFNVLLAFLLIFIAYRRSSRITFPATSRSLKALLSKESYEGLS
ncbi:MAG: phage holin family protein [Candidatus Competibacter denitrificans]|uniref:Transmembrane protein n=1 Tax=Candidatus Competibacter denitrificans Run_A_D11 TaxID=1400863 RepID=W6M4Z2_9GAMM|nr:phage holin family protein [Candidatus Competibacter denitrificans]CDI01689.1 conserved hypothetical protein [Candidatus Competibacter denitrificans Run_A_D11]HRC70383.1 phage holin family protein [Candidatus Competibacter denitrificans]